MGTDPGAADGPVVVGRAGLVRAALDPHQALASTTAYWREWIAQAKVEGPWAPVVHRSLLTLKALTNTRTGGIVSLSRRQARRLVSSQSRKPNSFDRLAAACRTSFDFYEVIGSVATQDYAIGEYVD